MNQFKKGDPLSHEPFSYEQAKDGQVQIFYSGRIVKTIKGKEAERFLFKVSGAGDLDSQHIMAKITGKFKFGNERDRRSHMNDD
jgi:hypothetical protein